MSNFLENFKRNKARNDSLIAVELKADQNIPATDPLKPAYQQTVERLKDNPLLKDTGLTDLAESVTESSGEVRHRDIVNLISDIGRHEEILLSEKREYEEDMDLMERLGKEEALWRNLVEEQKNIAYPTAAEFLFGASNKEEESKYGDAVNTLTDILAKRKQIWKKWNISMDPKYGKHGTWQQFGLEETMPMGPLKLSRRDHMEYHLDELNALNELLSEKKETYSELFGATLDEDLEFESKIDEANFLKDLDEFPQRFGSVFSAHKKHGLVFPLISSSKKHLEQ